LKCYICDETILKKDDKKGYNLRNRNIIICKNCYQRKYQSNRTADIMIVPINEKNFELALLKRIYICPTRYHKKIPKLLAFYRTQPISGITHFAKIKRIDRSLKKNQIIKDFSYYLKDFEHMILFEDSFNVFYLNDLVELSAHICKNNAGPIQSRIYSSFNVFFNSRSIDKLRKKIEN